MNIVDVGSDHSKAEACTRLTRGTIRALFLTPLLSLPAETRPIIDRLLAKHGFSRSQVKNPYDQLPLRSFIALTEDVAAALGRPHLGLELGQAFGLTDLGPFYLLLASAGTLRAALELFSRFQHTWQTQTSMPTSRDAETTTYGYLIQDSTIWPRRQDAEFAISAMVAYIKQMTTPKWSPSEVHFEHSIDETQSDIKRHFKARVLGRQPLNAIVIANSELDRPLGGHVGLKDKAFLAALERHLSDLLKSEVRTRETVAEAAASIISRRLGRASVDCNDVAMELGLSVRTFRRRLMLEGTTYRDLLQEHRMSVARQMLEQRQMPLSALAERLGYSDLCTFSRAFKLWAGISPKRYYAPA